MSMYHVQKSFQLFLVMCVDLWFKLYNHGDLEITKLLLSIYTKFIRRMVKYQQVYKTN